MVQRHRGTSYQYFLYFFGQRLKKAYKNGLIVIAGAKQHDN